MLPKNYIFPYHGIKFARGYNNSTSNSRHEPKITSALECSNYAFMCEDSSALVKTENCHTDKWKMHNILLCHAHIVPRACEIRS